MASIPNPEGPNDIRPLVARAGSDRTGVWLFAGAAAIAAVLLFTALDSRRREIAAPATTIPTGGESAVLQSPPPLAIPDGRGLDERFRIIPRPEPIVQTVREVLPVTSVPPPPARSRADTPPPPAQDTGLAAARPAVPVTTVFEPRSLSAPSAPAGLADRQTAGSDTRVSAGYLEHPARTVPQGTVIQAVLETAIDSTRAGGVRAIVSRDVRGFDGSRVLIPRGSRLYGETSADLSAGQNRALIRWTRLTRPDGAIIALDSPASDPLGRAGVKGKVDSHFLQRFGGAILQSVLDIGVGVATRRAAGDGVIVALPGSTQNITGQDASTVQRTLTVRQGTSVSVFVARDLDFSPVER